MDTSDQQGAPWIRIVDCHGCEGRTSTHKHVYLTASMWYRGSGLHQKLRVGAKWKDLICREFVMLHAILQSLDLGAATPKGKYLLNMSTTTLTMDRALSTAQVPRQV